MLDRLIPETVRFEIDAAPGDHTIRCDPVQLQQVLTNLTLNSSQAMPNGGEIRVRLTQDSQETCLWVTDDGKGLGAGFDLYQKKGLGLQLVNSIAENDLRGRFTLEPANPGVRACLRIPVAVPTAPGGDS